MSSHIVARILVIGTASDVTVTGPHFIFPWSIDCSSKYNPAKILAFAR